MLIFDFPFHTFTPEHPPSGMVVQLGRGWEFASAPDGPSQRLFKLNFQGMKYFFDEQGDPDPTQFPKRNILTLMNFYEQHLMHKKFYYDSELYGLTVCRFAQPPQWGEPIRGGDGVVGTFDVKLREIP